MNCLRIKPYIIQKAILDKSGAPLSKIISPVDNTGYRSRSGTPLNVFDSESDCKESWNDQMVKYVEEINILISSAANDWIKEKKKLITMME